MREKAKNKIIVRKEPARKRKREKIKIRFIAASAILIAASGAVGGGQTNANAAGCPDVEIIFARGSGGERWTTDNYLEFKSTIEDKLETTSLHYEFVDLDYPAVGVGADHIGTLLGAYFGSGDAYDFGESVEAGVEELMNIVNDTTRCPDTKYVLGGYSQGAMVVSRAIQSLRQDKLIYAATFGDPKIYLPEGEGLIPAACRGDNLSDYRMYVPDCQAYNGMLGAYIPYEPDGMTGKMGTWCNKRDIFCSSHLSIGDHTSYVEDNLYEDASRVIFDKITQAFGIENHISSPHDTVFLIDSTGSMRSMITKYKEEAYRLAKETLATGGRVALYDYRDLRDPYEVKEHCNFETCTLETFARGLDEITVGGGGDELESLLSSSLKVMNDLEWRLGSTKSLVVLTDTSFLSPDRDGTTVDEVIALSKTIDPVNFYVITKNAAASAYTELASRTDGMVVTDLGRLSLLTDYIISRYDSLPRVEETDPRELPTVTVLDTEWIDETTARIRLTSTGTQTLVALNDAILGVTEDTTLELTDLDSGRENVVTLVPLGDDVRGESVAVSLDDGRGMADEGGDADESGDGIEDDGADENNEPAENNGANEHNETNGDDANDEANQSEQDQPTVIPKAPNTGMPKRELDESDTGMPKRELDESDTGISKRELDRPKIKV